MVAGCQSPFPSFAILILASSRRFTLFGGKGFGEGICRFHYYLIELPMIRFGNRLIARRTMSLDTGSRSYLGILEGSVAADNDRPGCHHRGRGANLFLYVCSNAGVGFRAAHDELGPMRKKVSGDTRPKNDARRNAIVRRSRPMVYCADYRCARGKDQRRSMAGPYSSVRP
jgi:hypothetical protein